MCARYTMATPSDELIAEFEATLVADAARPRYNIAPTDGAPIVALGKAGERQIGLARFGFIPHWAKDRKIGVRMLNARVETVADKPAFRTAYHRHRCLVVADGFYEWRKDPEAADKKKRKTPMRFVLPDGPAFGMAGLFSVWRDPEGEKVSSFTVLTREALGAVATIHHRMPVVLRQDDYAAWLSRDTEGPALSAILERHRGALLGGYEVDRRVGSVRNDDASLIEPVEPA
ncbi:MAG: SOS response-associated peptidase [Sandaracinaceae bacterium]